MEEARDEATTTDSAAASGSDGEEVPQHENPTLIPELAKTEAAPAVEVHLFRRGRGPAAVFRSSLGGRDRDRLDVRRILQEHGLKSLFALGPASGRGAPIRFSPRDGRSYICYSDGAVIFVDGEPKESMARPISKILFGVIVIALLAALLVHEMPAFSGGGWSPWVLACAVVVFTRVRKRAKGFLNGRGWVN